MAVDYQGWGREDLLRERARHPLVKARLDELQAKLNELDAELDRAVEQHHLDCARPQADLRAIENRQLDAILSKQPLDEATEAERKRLLAKIEQNNLVLETCRDEVERRKRIVAAERDKVAADVPIVEIINANLFRSADPAKQTQYNALAEAAKRINDAILFSYDKAVDGTRISLQECTHQGDHEMGAQLQERLNRQTAVQAVLRKAVRQMQTSAQEIFDELIEA